MNKLIKNFILFIVASVLFVILAPIGFVYGILTRLRFDLSKFFRNLAVSIDQTGGVFVQYLFDDIMIVDGGASFGNPDYTISAILGANEIRDTLSKIGKVLAGLLNKLEKDHCKNAYKKEFNL